MAFGGGGDDPPSGLDADILGYLQFQADLSKRRLELALNNNKVTYLRFGVAIDACE